MRVFLEGNGWELVLQEEPLARGGEAAVFALVGEGALVAKVYHRPTPEHADKLEALLAVGPPEPLTHLDVAWPTGRLLGADGRQVVGCLMPRVANARPVCELYNPRARRRTCPLFHYGHLLRAARNLSAAVRRLHERGCVVGDLNESNVLVTPRALVTLVDADSFQVRTSRGLHRCRVGKPEFTPPELQGADFAAIDRRPEHDAFALGVLIFQLLMQGTHPFAGMFTGAGEPAPVAERIRAGHWPYAWERVGPFQPVPHAPPWDVLPPPVRELFLRCFEEGHARPQRRPTALEWQKALDEAGTRLAVCTGNAQHHYPRGLDVCPWCVLARQHDHDPFPSPAELQERRRAREAPILLEEVVAVAVAGPATLDPSDPLPPGRRQPAAVVVAAPSRRVARTKPPPLPVARQGGWAPWVAAAALGALLGVLVVLWRYQPGPPAHAAHAAHAETPAEAEQKRAAVTAAQQACQEALQDLQRAQREYDVLEKEYQKSVATLQPTRANQAVLARYLVRMRTQLAVVREKERVLSDRRRLLDESRGALAQKTS